MAGGGIDKQPMVDQVFAKNASALGKYRAFFVGRPGWGALIAYEILTSLLGPMPGAPGLVLRKLFYPDLCRDAGSGVMWGRDIALRHPWKLTVGDRVAIDDRCLIDAHGGDGIEIGDDVIVARDCIVQAKTGSIKIGSRCIIGSQCQLSSAGGIVLGSSVMIAGQCYLGGGRYHTEDPSVPIMDQGLYTKGPLVIEDNVWIGAGAVIQDGVRIGRGSVIGAGAVVREDVPPMTTVVPQQRLVMLPRIQGTPESQPKS